MICSSLGYKDSNLEMLESESSALPFGDTPKVFQFRDFCLETTATNDIITDRFTFCKTKFYFFAILLTFVD